MGRLGKTKYLFTIGDIVGYNKILSNSDSGKFLCQCTCNKSIPRWLYGYSIIKEMRCSECGNSQRGKDNGNFKGYEEIPGKYLKMVNRINKNNGYPKSDITLKYLWELYKKQNKKCAISGLDISFLSIKCSWGYRTTASLDRIDSERGYMIDNVQWVHKHINIMKNEYPIGLFISLCKLVSNMNTNKPIEVDIQTNIDDYIRRHRNR